jgi:hypothetical protein
VKTVSGSPTGCFSTHAPRLSDVHKVVTVAIRNFISPLRPESGSLKLRSGAATH